jgi:hypothetical protein
VGILDRTTFCDGHHIGTGNIEPKISLSPREARMLAEIFLLRLEATARAAKEAATITRSTSPFVPVTLPVPTPKAA